MTLYYGGELDAMWNGDMDVGDGWLHGVYFSLYAPGAAPSTPETPSDPDPLQNTNYLKVQITGPDEVDEGGTIPLAAFIEVGTGTWGTATWGIVTETTDGEVLRNQTGANITYDAPIAVAAERTARVSVTVTAQNLQAVTVVKDITIRRKWVTYVQSLSNIRPPAPVHVTGGYVFASTADPEVVGGAPLDDPSWADIADIEAAAALADPGGEGPYDALGTSVIDADGVGIASAMWPWLSEAYVGAGSPDSPEGFSGVYLPPYPDFPVSVQWRRNATETITWAELDRVGNGKGGGTGTINVDVLRWWSLSRPVFGSGLDPTDADSGPGDGRAYLVVRQSLGS